MKRENKKRRKKKKKEVIKWLWPVSHGTRRSDSLCCQRLIRDSVIPENTAMARNVAETAAVYDRIWWNLTATLPPVIRVQAVDKDFGGVGGVGGVDENVVIDSKRHVIIEFASPLRHFQWIFNNLSEKNLIWWRAVNFDGKIVFTMAYESDIKARYSYAHFC